MGAFAIFNGIVVLLKKSIISLASFRFFSTVEKIYFFDLSCVCH